MIVILIIVINMITIYLLRLEQNKYYIGKTKDVNVRFKDHCTGIGSAWTNKYKPIEIMETFANCDEFDEDKYTKMFMAKYGVDNVRGGSYVQIVLDDNTVKLLEKELKSATNSCFKCGSNEHYVMKCPNNNTKVSCSRCGRTGHILKDCFARYDVDGDSIDSSDSSDDEYTQQRPCVGCGNFGHKVGGCQTTKNVCYRCGREDHWKITCTADKDINGYDLKSHLLGTIGSFIKGWF